MKNLHILIIGIIVIVLIETVVILQYGDEFSNVSDFFEPIAESTRTVGRVNCDTLI